MEVSEDVKKKKVTIENRKIDKESSHYYRISNKKEKRKKWLKKESKYVKDTNYPNR